MQEHPRRVIQSFGRRRGRKLQGARERLVEKLLPELAIPLPSKGTVLSMSDLFSDEKEQYALEIGFGAGEHLAARASSEPNTGFIGCEPYINGTGTLLRKIEADNLENVRLYPGDARQLMDTLPDACITHTYILFPDPWPKARHHKRRLIQMEFLDALARVIKPSGTLLFASDHADYVSWSLERMLAHPLFSWTVRSKSDWQMPPEGWVCTKYQKKAEAEGRGATFLHFTHI